MAQQRKRTSTNYLNEQRLLTDCPMQSAMRLLGGRWKIVLVWYIAEGINRFSALRRHIPDVSSKMLTQQLRELEADALIQRVVVTERPAHVEYMLTERTRTLLPVLAALNAWSLQQRAGHEGACDWAQR